MESYKLYNKDLYLGTITYDKPNDKYYFEKSTASTGYPAPICKDIISGECKEIVGDKDVREFIEDRVLPEDRQAIDEFLFPLDMLVWDAWELFVKTSGMTMIDMFWIDSYGAKSYKDHCRETGKLPYETYL